MSEKGTFHFVGPALTLAELAQVIQAAQENGMGAGIAKHLELAEDRQGIHENLKRNRIARTVKVSQSHLP